MQRHIKEILWASSMLKAVIFDMDGVLVKNSGIVQESFNRVLEKEGIQFSNEDWQNFLSRSLKDLVHIWREQYGVTTPFEVLSKATSVIQFQLLEERHEPNLPLIAFLRELEGV